MAFVLYYKAINKTKLGAGILFYITLECFLVHNTPVCDVPVSL